MPYFIQKHLFALLCLLCLSFLAAAQENVSLLNKNPQQSNLSSSLEGLNDEFDMGVDFLPVHQAYQLETQIEASAKTGLETAKITLLWQISPGYFLYGDQFQFELSQNQQDLQIDITKETGEITYDDYFERDVEKFYQQTSQILILSPDTFSQINPEKNLLLSARFQGCADAGLCYPPETLYFNIDLNTLMATAVPDPSSLQLATNKQINQSVTSSIAAPTSFLTMFIFALLGGLILNLMPCVFPVLSIKLLSFVNANQSAAHLKAHSWFYTLGVLTTFLVTALLLILLRQSGMVIGWGFQLQSPIFIGFLAGLFLVLALSLSGFIQLGTRFMGIGQQLTDGEHYKNSFFTGVLAVIVASPCSVPFMGIALGYALTQPLYAALIIFSGLGFGLAAPFLIFAYIPWLIQHLPKPGLWMETLKHWLALPLYLTTAWLLWVLFSQLTAHTNINTDSHLNTSQYAESYSKEKLTQYLDNNESVFINLTADWCITCIVNEKMALSTDSVQQAMRNHNIHYLIGDWTNGDPEITALLESHQRGGVPLYVFYNQQGEVNILPQLLSEKIVLKIFQNTNP